MRIKFAIIAASAFTLTACGPSQEDKEAEFRTNFVESCVKSAVATGADEDTAKTVCDCGAGKVIEEVGMELTPLPAKSKEIMDACIAETDVAAEG